MSSFHYDNSEFTAISVLTWVSLFISMLMTIANLFRHWMAKYSSVRRRAMIMIFVNMLIIIVLLFMALWLYKGAEAFFLVVLILISINLALLYVYIRETLTMYMSKWLKENTHLAKELITNEGIRKLMTENEYPMEKVILFERIKIQNYFIAWWYTKILLILFYEYCNKVLNNFVFAWNSWKIMNMLQNENQ